MGEILGRRQSARARTGRPLHARAASGRPVAPSAPQQVVFAIAEKGRARGRCRDPRVGQDAPRQRPHPSRETPRPVFRLRYPRGRPARSAATPAKQHTPFTRSGSSARAHLTEATRATLPSLSTPYRRPAAPPPRGVPRELCASPESAPSPDTYTDRRPGAQPLNRPSFRGPPGGTLRRSSPSPGRRANRATPAGTPSMSRAAGGGKNATGGNRGRRHPRTCRRAGLPPRVAERPL